MAAAVLGLASACAGVRGPAWAGHPCSGEAPGSVCATGYSDLAAGSAEAGRTAAELDAAGGVARQLRECAAQRASRVGVPVPAPDAEATRVGGLVVAGLRFKDYAYEPGRSSPKEIWVRAVLDPPSAERSCAAELDRWKREGAR